MTPAARLDPTRILVVKRAQEHDGYSPDNRWKTAINWTGDVVSKKVEGKLWEKEPKEMTRALIGDYYAELYWKPVLESLADGRSFEGSEWLSGICALPPEAFITTRRTTLINLYSRSSKAIHHEYVTEIPSMFDRVSSIDLVHQVLKVLSEFAVLLDSLPHVPYRLGHTKVYTIIKKIENFEVAK